MEAWGLWERRNKKWRPWKWKQGDVEDYFRECIRRADTSRVVHLIWHGVLLGSMTKGIYHFLPCDYSA